MNEVFNIEKFNLISDEENYYFFRSLEDGDIEDLEKGIIVMEEDGHLSKIRTDSKRWNERNDEKAIYSEESEVSLEEMFSHIKMHYSLQTNCISLSSNANVVRTYEDMFSSNYVMVKVPKKEIGKTSFNAGQYMLSEIEKRINDVIENKDISDEILKDLKEVDSATDNNKLKELIQTRYKSLEKIKTNRAKMKEGIVYRSPHARISSYQSLNSEQILEKNKIIAKLTILEKKKIMEPIIPHSKNNNLLIQTVGSAFSSSEQIYYGDIKGKQVQSISKEIVDIFGLLQQVEGQDKNIVYDLKNEVINFVNNGNSIELPNNNDNYNIKENISIEEMYKLTNGRVEYGSANSIVKNTFYLSRAQSNARKLASVLKDITKNNSKYNDIIKYITKNGFVVEPKIITRRNNKGVKLSEAVNLNLKGNEKQLVEEIKKLTDEEQIKLLEDGGLSDTNGIITNCFSKIEQTNEISKDRYYAEAIISSYNWQDIGIAEFSVSQKNEFIEKLKEKNCVEIYNKLKDLGIQEKDVPTIALNIVTRENYYNYYKENRLEQLLQENSEILNQKLSISLTEKFLGYYDVEKTEIKLKDYQQRALDNVDKIFEDKKFAQVILPTGAGKSFVSISEMIRHKNEPILYLAPQEEILNQVKDYIIKYIIGRKDTLGKNVDEIIAKEFPNLKFETYPGLLARRGKEIIKEEYGLIVVDEIHRTGAKEYEGKIDELYENQNENVKVLGITATPVRDIDGRDMAKENALKLGYTQQEVDENKHLASNMTLKNAIRLGIVVNPKIVLCKYSLLADGKMDELKEKIENIPDEDIRNRKRQDYEKLKNELNKEIDEELGEEFRKNLDKGIGIEEILKQNVQKGGRYIVFIPVSDQGDIEDEDGNRIGLKNGEDKIQEYKKYLERCFEDSNINIQCKSLLGSYTDKKNKQELEEFESDQTDDIKFMIVMNKANEGLHIEGINGIVWFRALDKNSRILYFQQLGRAIYALDEDNPISDKDRPVVIDLANNTLNVKVDKEFEEPKIIDDLTIIETIADWIHIHNDMFPDKDSSSRQERTYYSNLRRIQNKYKKYLDGFENFEDLKDEDISKINNIIAIANEIDLWNRELEQIIKQKARDKEINPFEITGILKDYYELEEEIDNELNKTTYDEVIEFLEKNDGRMMKAKFSKNGEVLRIKDMIEEQRYEKNLYYRWRRTEECEILEGYEGRDIKEVPEKCREKIAKLRSLIKKEKTTYEEVIEFLEKNNGKMMQGAFKRNGKVLKTNNMTVEQRYERNLYAKWIISEENEMLKEYKGKDIEEVPEEYREKIAKLREYGLGLEKKTTYEEVIEFLEKSDGQIMQSSFMRKGKVLKSSELTEEQKYEQNLYGRWIRTEEYKILEEYKGKDIKEVPEEYKEKITKLRKYGLGIEEKTIYEEVIKFLEENDGQMLHGNFRRNGRILGISELTEKQKYEKNLYKRWRRSEENKILKEYEGKDINKVPEEYREKITKLRKYGLGTEEKKSIYEEVIEFLEKNNGKIMQSCFKKEGKTLKAKDLTEKQRYEQNLYNRWRKTEERKILKEYEGNNIEEVPKEYREKIAKLREFGLGLSEDQKKEEDKTELKTEILQLIDQRDKLSQKTASIEAQNYVK